MSKPINQLTEESLFIKNFISVKDAAIELGLNRGNISAVLKGKLLTTGGFKFEYNIPDLPGECRNGVVYGVDVKVYEIGSILINGKYTNPNGKAMKQIKIKRKHCLISRIVYAIWNSESYENLPEDYCVQRKDGITTDYKPDNLKLVHKSDVDINATKGGETRSKPVELVECDDNSKPQRDDNDEEIVLREYSSPKEASEKSGEHTGEKVGRGAIYERIANRVKITINDKKYIYRYKVTYTFNDDEIKAPIDDSIRSKLTEFQTENLGNGGMVTNYGNIIDSYGRVITESEFTKVDGYCLFGGIRVHILVAHAFIPNPEGKPTVDHIDGNRSNNHVSNLRWATREEQANNMSTNIIRKKNDGQK